jgi:hypothetical protein
LTLANVDVTYNCSADGKGFVRAIPGTNANVGEDAAKAETVSVELTRVHGETIEMLNILGDTYVKGM